MTMSSYDEELVVVSVVEEDVDLETSFLVVAACRSRFTAVTCSSTDLWLGHVDA
jgi:hypothetical protein